MEPETKGRGRWSRRINLVVVEGESIAVGNSGAAPHGRGDRGRHDQYIED
jgi:hypothetical protein